jgi:hypothetical protein
MVTFSEYFYCSLRLECILQQNEKHLYSLLIKIIVVHH